MTELQSLGRLDLLSSYLSHHLLESTDTVAYTVQYVQWYNTMQQLLLQALAALRAHGAAMEAGLPQQSMQAEMAAFLVISATLAHLFLMLHDYTNF